MARGQEPGSQGSGQGRSPLTPANDLVTLEYDRHKAEVMRTVASKLSAAGVGSSEADLDASYNEAWHALYLALADGEEIENRIGYLVTVTYRRALNEVRALKVSRRADSTELDMVGVELDIDSQLDAQIQLRQIREGFRSKLSARELEAATLCHLYGYTRPEAAEAMGVRPKRMEKIMDRASARIGTVVETVRSGEHCAELAPTIRAFAVGMLNPDGEKYHLASDHLEHCSACRREVWTDRGLAAIGPPLPLAFALLAGGAGITGVAAGGLALAGGGKTGAAGGVAKGGAAVGKGASAGRKAALAGSATAAVAAVAVAAGLATGTIGGGSDPVTGDGAEPSIASADAAGGSGSAASANAAAARQAARAAAARKAAKKARAKAKAEKRRAARAAAAAAAAAQAVAEQETAYVPEPTYVPPEPDPVVSDPAPETQAKPDPATPPKREPNQSKPVDTKPTTDAGEEFGLR